MLDYNFFAPYQRKYRFELNLRSPFLAVGLAILLIALAGGLSAGRTKMMQMEEQRLQHDLQLLKESEAYKKGIVLQEEIANIQSYDQSAQMALDRFTKNDLINTEFLNTLAQAMPQTARIKGISITREAVALIFHTPDRKTAAELVQSVEALPTVHSILLADVSVATEETATGFEVSMAAAIQAKAGAEE